jgi:hypothetical protein
MTRFNSNFNGALPFSDISGQVGLAANTALPYTVPGDNTTRYRIEFSWSYNANVYVGYNVTAVVPVAGTLTDDANIEFRPSVRYVRGGDELSFISRDATPDFGFSLLQLPG